MPSKTLKIALMLVVVISVSALGAILDGSSVPADSTGSDGDYYIKTPAGTWYKKASGHWALLAATMRGDRGEKGIRGEPGAPASTLPLLTGTSSPSGSSGSSGQLYLDTANGDLLLKSGTAWQLKTNLRGPAGATGPAGTAPDALRLVEATLAHSGDDVTCAPNTITLLAGSEGDTFTVNAGASYTLPDTGRVTIMTNSSGGENVFPSPAAL